MCGASAQAWLGVDYEPGQHDVRRQRAGTGEVVEGPVEDHEAQSAAEHDPDGGPGDELFQLCRVEADRMAFDDPDGVAPAAENAGDIGERIPTKVEAPA